MTLLKPDWSPSVLHVIILFEAEIDAGFQMVPVHKCTDWHRVLSFVAVLHSPALLASLQAWIFPFCAVFFFCILAFSNCIFLLFIPSFFAFDSDVVCFILYFSCEYYAVSSVLGFAAARLAHDTYLFRTFTFYLV